MRFTFNSQRFVVADPGFGLLGSCRVTSCTFFPLLWLCASFDVSRQCRTNKSRSRIDDVTNASRRAIAGDSSRLRVHGARAVIHDQHRSITFLCQRRLRRANIHARRGVRIIRRHLWTLHLQAAIGKTSSLGPKPTIGATSAKCPPGPTGSPFLNGLSTNLDAVWLEVYLDLAAVSLRVVLCRSALASTSLILHSTSLPYFLTRMNARFSAGCALHSYVCSVFLSSPRFTLSAHLQPRLCMLVPTSSCLVLHGGLSNHVWTVRTTDVV